MDLFLQSTTLTITNCPCTVTKPVYTAPVLYCSTQYSRLPFAGLNDFGLIRQNSQSSAYIPPVVYTTPVATIASSSPVPYTSTFPVPYTSNEVVYTSSIPVVSTRTSIISIQVSSVVQVPTSAVEVPTSAVEVPTSAAEVPTSAVVIPTSAVVVPTTRGPVPSIPAYPNITSTYVAPPAGTATGGAPAATTTGKVFLGAANKAFVASGASLAGLLGLAAILL